VSNLVISMRFHESGLLDDSVYADVLAFQ